MRDMSLIAKDFQNKHKRGVVSKVTSYSFTYTENNKSTVYMISYFWEKEA